MLKKVYIEITNCCNLSCAFCPGTRREKRFMSPEEFGRVLRHLTGETKYIYYHIMGEPLLHPALGELLRLAAEGGFRSCITTNGTLLPRRAETLLAAPALHKISVSLHSLEGSGRAEDMGAYLTSVWAFCERAAERGVICALRLWNDGGLDSRNGEILDFLRQKTGTDHWPELRGGSRKLGENLYLENAARFHWPDLAAEAAGTEFCYGLRDQAGILADGTVVPCCLDHEGDVPLGNIFHAPLGEILASPRARALYDGFSARRPTEELCRRCGYATRFNR